MALISDESPLCLSGCLGRAFCSHVGLLRLAVPHMVGINLRRLGHLSVVGSRSLVHRLFCLYFCYWMDPLNARAAWSSVVGALEHGEMSQKNVVENIFLWWRVCCSLKWII